MWLLILMQSNPVGRGHSQRQGMITPICAVLTAKTGVKKFWPSLWLLDCLTALQICRWLFTTRTFFHLTKQYTEESEATPTLACILEWPLLERLLSQLQSRVKFYQLFQRFDCWPFDLTCIAPLACSCTVQHCNHCPYNQWISQLLWWLTALSWPLTIEWR